MVKFSKDVSNLNHKIVGRKDSVKREVKLLLGEWGTEKTHIKKSMWNIKSRTFVSVYSGRVCIGTIFFCVIDEDRTIWELSHAIVRKKSRGCGLGRKLATAAISFIFQNGCKKLYLAAECLAKDETKNGKSVYQDENESQAFKFWKSLGFKKIAIEEYDQIYQEKENQSYDWEGMIPMKLTKRSKIVKEMPQFEITLDSLFSKLKKITKKKTPMIRLCGKTRMGNSFDMCIQD